MLYFDMVVICYEMLRVALLLSAATHQVGRNVDLHRLWLDTKDTDDLTHTIRAIVKEEKRIVVYKGSDRSARDE